jgi:O-antigen/teichoic acid export membrane protein
LIVPASTALAVLSKDIIYLIYGRSYSLAPSFLSLYALTFLYAGIGSAVLSYFFNGTGETGVVFKSNLINLIVFLPLASALTMLYRVPGLIIALLVSGIFPLFYGLFVAKKKFQAEIDALASIKIYAASFISAIVVLAFTIFLRNSLINVVFGGLIFVLAYLTLLSLIGGISAYDLENFELMFRNKSLWFIIKPIIKYEKKLLAKVEIRGKQKY